VKIDGSGAGSWTSPARRRAGSAEVNFEAVLAGQGSGETSAPGRRPAFQERRSEAAAQLARPEAAGNRAQGAPALAGRIAAPSAVADASPARAFGFAELGLFGADGAVAASQTWSGQGAPPDPASQAVASEAPASASERPSATPPSLIPGPGGEAQATAPGAAADLPTPDRSGLAAAPQPFAAMAPSALARSTGARTNAAVGSDAPLPETVWRPPPAAAAQVAVALAEATGAVRIVAAAPGLSPQAQQQVRQAALRLADEFGLPLDEFSLNGVTIPSPETGRNGVVHGHLPS